MALTSHASNGLLLPMAKYVLTYDLEDDSYKNTLPEHLRKEWGARLVARSSYAIETDKTKTEIWEDVEKFTKDQISGYVFEVTGTCVGSGKATDWLRENGF